MRNTAEGQMLNALHAVIAAAIIYFVATVYFLGRWFGAW